MFTIRATLITMKTLFRFVFVYLASAGLAFAANDITINFDDLSTGRFSLLPNDYAGFQWTNFYFLDAAIAPPSGAQNGMLSDPNIAFNGLGNSASVSSGGAFDFNSAYLTAIWNDGLQLEVQGYVGTILTYDNSYTLNTASALLINFDYLNVDEVTFITSGGTPHSGYTGHGTQFAIDDLTVAVPEPTTMSLFGICMLLFPAFRRPNKSPEPTAVGAVRSAIAVHVASRRWLSFLS